MIEISSLIIGLLGSIVSWVGAIILIAMLLSVAIPLLYKEQAEDIDVKIAIKSFVLLHITNKYTKMKITIFHKQY